MFNFLVTKANLIERTATPKPISVRFAAQDELALLQLLPEIEILKKDYENTNCAHVAAKTGSLNCLKFLGQNSRYKILFKAKNKSGFSVMCMAEIAKKYQQKTMELVKKINNNSIHSEVDVAGNSGSTVEEPKVQPEVQPEVGQKKVEKKERVDFSRLVKMAEENKNRLETLMEETKEINEILLINNNTVIQ